MPCAFSSSGKQFPAQVHILQLFSSRRLNSKMPRRQTAKETREVGKDRRVDDDMVMVIDTFGPDTGDYITLNEYSKKSLDEVEGVDDDRFLMGDKVENEHKVDSNLRCGIWTYQPGVYWTKKRKINNNGRFSTGSELYNDLGPRHSTSGDFLGDSFGKIKSVDDVWLSADDRVTEYHIMNNNLGPAISSEYPRKSFNKGRRVTEDDRFMNEMVENKCDIGNAFGPFVSTEQREKPSGKDRLLLDDNRFSVSRYCVGNEHRMDSGIRPVLSVEHLRNSQGKRHIDDDWFLMNGRLQSKRYVDDGIGSVISTEHLGNSLGRVARANDVRNFLMRETAETDCHISSQHFENAMDKFRRETEDRLDIEHNMDNGFGPGISTEFSRYTTLCKGKLLADGGRFRKSDRVENVRDIDSRIGPAFSSHITASCQSGKNLFMNSIKRYPSAQNLFMSSIKPNLESESYLLHDQIQHSLAFLSPNGPQTLNKSYSTSHDAAVTKTVPYDPEFPDIRYRCSSPLVASHSFNSAQDHSSHQGSEENFIPLSNTEGLTHLLESKRLARCLDVASGNGNKISSPNIYDHHNQSSHRSSNTFLNSGYPESSELRTSESKGSKDSLYSDSILASPSFPNGRSTEKLNKGPLSCAFSSSKNLSFAFDKGYPEESQQGRYELKIPQRERNEAFTAKEFDPSHTVWSCSSRLHYGSSPQDQEKNPVNHTSELYSATKNDRTSVFARLSVAPEVCLHEDDNDTYMARNECDMDASVDEVMDLLHQAHNHWVKVEKYRPNNGDGNIRYKEKSKFQKRTEFEQSMVTKKKMESDASRAIKANVDTVLKETRLVDFKRRSKIKKNLDENITKNSDGISEGTASIGTAKPSSLMSKTSVNAVDEGLLGAGKSRKLTRPDFGKKECYDESKDGDSTPYGRPPFEESSYQNNTASCKDALKSLESTDMVSCNAGVAHANLPFTSDDNTTSEQTPGCKLNGNSKMCEASINQDSEDGKEILQDIKIGNTVSQVPPSETNQDVRAGLEIEDWVKVSIQDLLSMIGSSSSAQISPPVLTEVTADPGI